MSLILGSSGELPDRNAHQLDLHHSIVTIEQQRFFDIGVDISTNSVLLNA